MTPAGFAQRYGPWAVVVGASDGIGAAFATALARRGLDLVLVARRRPLLEELAADLRTRHGVRTEVVVADVATRDGLETVRALPDRTGEAVGLLVVNAALAPVAPFLELSPEQLDAMLDLNCRAAAQLARGYGPSMVDRGRGGIVLLSSMAGNQGAALVAHYAATKAYLRVLAEGLWAELRPAGVDVLACCPGLVRTPTFDRGAPEHAGLLVPPPMEPAAVAGAALTALGRQPVVIPGWRNRVSALAAARLLPRRAMVRLASNGTTGMYPRGSRRPARPGGPSG